MTHFGHRRRASLGPLGRAALLASFLAIGSSAAFAQAVLPGPDASAPDEQPLYRVPLMYDPRPSDLRVPAPPEVRLQQKGLAKAQATVNVTFLAAGTTNIFGDHCVAWTAPAQAAFNFAANIWASQLQSSVPLAINACYANDLGAGVLGSAGPRTFYRDFPNAPRAGTWYPVALANALSGSDRNPSLVDIEASFSSTFNWYYGTDGNVPVGQMDFVSVVMHEIGHGLGFTGGLNVAGGIGSWDDPVPFVYDRFTENLAGVSLLLTTTFPNPSAALGAALQSNNVFFDGANANAGNGGARVPLYAPTTWNDGSSYSHLAESFNNTPNALMTFSLASRESIHSPGPVTLGLLRDLGWQLQTASTADLSVSQTVSTNPATVGKDAVVTMTVTNGGPGTATGVSLTATPDATTSVIWTSPGCVFQSAHYVCSTASLANGASAKFKIVLRKAVNGLISNGVTVTSATADPNAANNTSNLAVSAATGPVPVPVLRYRLYSDLTKEHHFTTDFNEYTVLGGNGVWVQEGTVGKVLNNPGSFNGVAAVPYYRLYDTSTRWHHWTTDANEYYTLSQYAWWNGEGVDGYILPSNTTGATQLFRLTYPALPGLHHWTIDPVEYNALIASFGWLGEPGAGFVIQ